MSDDYDMTAAHNTISVNPSNTVGIRRIDFTTNETRSTRFSPKLLREWAAFVEDVYGEQASVEVVFTPDCPLVARATSDKEYEETIGACVAPRIDQEGNDNE